MSCRARDSVNEAHPQGLPVYSVDDADDATALLQRIGHRAKDGNYYCILPEFDHELFSLADTRKQIHREYQKIHAAPPRTPEPQP